MSVGTQIPKATDVRELSPVISTRYALTWRHAVVVGCFAFSFLLINHMPVSLHSVWRHANSGDWILAHHAVPDALPYATYAEGMPFVSQSWLTDTFIASGIRLYGFEFISGAMAVLTTASLGFWCWLNYRQARQKRYVVLSVVSMMLVWSFGLAALRAQVFAGTLLPILLWLVWPSPEGLARTRSDHGGQTLRTLGIGQILGTGAIMVVWANLDVSFFLGLAVLGCVAVGEIVEAWMGNGDDSGPTRLSRTFRNPRVQQALMLAELAAVATLLSPRGWEIWLSLVQLNTRGPIWSTVGGAYGLRLATTPGVFFGAIVTFVLAAWHVSGLKMKVCDICLFLVVVVATALHTENIYWLVSVALFLAARHWPDLMAQRGWRRERRDPAGSEYHPLLFAWSLICLLFVWCAFSFSPISAPLLSSKKRPIERILDATVPVDVADFLCNESYGVVWAPADWCDWIAWSSHRRTSGDAIPMFVNSEIRHFPAAVQRDYSRIFRADKEWNNLTKQYNIETLVIDKTRQSALAREVIRSGHWRLAMETNASMVLFLNGVGS